MREEMRQWTDLTFDAFDLTVRDARVSTDAQETHLQIDALKRAKCGRVYEKASGAKPTVPS